MRPSFPPAAILPLLGALFLALPLPCGADFPYAHIVGPAGEERLAVRFDVSPFLWDNAWLIVEASDGGLDDWTTITISQGIGIWTGEAAVSHEPGPAGLIRFIVEDVQTIDTTHRRYMRLILFFPTP